MYFCTVLLCNQNYARKTTLLMYVFTFYNKKKNAFINVCICILFCIAKHKNVLILSKVPYFFFKLHSKFEWQRQICFKIEYNDWWMNFGVLTPLSANTIGSFLEVSFYWWRRQDTLILGMKTDNPSSLRLELSTPSMCRILT